MTLPDLSLYLVAGRPACSRSLEETVAAAVRGGVTIVQLRDPDGATRDLIADAGALLNLLRPLGIPLIINDRVDVVLATGADGVHLGQDDMTARDARTVLGPDRIIGLSVGSSGEVEGSREDLRHVDYVGIGPIRGTSTKADAGAAIGVDGFQKVLSLVDRPAVAIGGLGLGSVGPVIRAGARGVAVVSAICGADDPETAARRIREEIAAAR
ncbi:thiamine phosphate synthase [Terrihabitans rhizophilus]|uniref:Thiamine-phosphate synthase n=1 Tax=Terrihabitans rhizophilus TaxID=3092662 RepID=A0ABU4RPW9_9HYPH|nr:thiamine phosphate synthase [Terrihabitans sp. PJ23]MDX6806867.1 thiamine phosphate synthase [Terrihabitans sp. PJ23]